MCCMVDSNKKLTSRQTNHIRNMQTAYKENARSVRGGSKGDARNAHRRLHLKYKETDRNMLGNKTRAPKLEFRERRLNHVFCVRL